MKKKIITYLMIILMLFSMFATQAFALPPAPIFVSAITNVAGDKITVFFDKPMTDPSLSTSNSALDFIINYGGTTQTAIIATLSSTTTMAMDLVFDTPIKSGVVTLDYTPGTVSSSDGGILAGFAGASVTNQVPAVDTNLEGSWQIYNHTGNWGEAWDSLSEPYAADAEGIDPEDMKHIVIFNNGERITFYGYGEPSFKDFLYLPNSEATTKIFQFDLDLSGVDYHSMEGGGFFFNTAIVDGLLSGYCLLIEEDNIARLYEIDSVNANNFHEAIDAADSNNDWDLNMIDYEGITQLGEDYQLQEGTLHAIRVEVSPTNLEMWDVTSAQTTKVIDGYVLENAYGNGIGLIASYTNHGCEDLSYFTFNNLVIRGIKIVWPNLTENVVSSVYNWTNTKPEQEKNILRFNVDKIDSFLTSGSSIEELHPMDIAPVLLEERTLLPIRFVVEPLGGKILWSPAERKVTITRGTTSIELWIGSNVAKVNGVEKTIDPDNLNVKPILMGHGRTMLPLRFISEALGCTVNWDQTTQKIEVTDW